MECTEFEALLSEAMDGAVDGAIVGEAMGDDGYSALSAARKEFRGSSAGLRGLRSAVCGRAGGAAWLRSLEAVEPPAYWCTTF
jgi:hypothetical protein